MEDGKFSINKPDGQELKQADNKEGEASIIDAIDDKGVYVVINQSASDSILNYAQSDTSCELGGVLLGSYIEKEGKYLVKIEAAIEALYSETKRTNIKFTHKTWEYIDKVKEAKYPETRIVGWYHTHPGFGIFLSKHDQFIHSNFFNLPWQVAYVIDPVQGLNGFFGWSDNNIDKIPFKTKFNPDKTFKGRTFIASGKGKKSKKKGLLFMGILALIFISSLVLNYYQFNSIRGLQEERDAYKNLYLEEINQNELLRDSNIEKEDEIRSLEDINIEQELMIKDLENKLNSNTDTVEHDSHYPDMR